MVYKVYSPMFREQELESLIDTSSDLFDFLWLWIVCVGWRDIEVSDEKNLVWWKVSSDTLVIAS